MTTTGRSAETDMEAMVVRLHDGSLLLVDNRSGSPFVPTAIYEADIIGLDGQTLTVPMICRWGTWCVSSVTAS